MNTNVKIAIFVVLAFLLGVWYANTEFSTRDEIGTYRIVWVSKKEQGSCGDGPEKWYWLAERKDGWFNWESMHMCGTDSVEKLRAWVEKTLQEELKAEISKSNTFTAYITKKDHVVLEKDK